MHNDVCGCKVEAIFLPIFQFLLYLSELIFQMYDGTTRIDITGLMFWLTYWSDWNYDLKNKEIKGKKSKLAWMSLYMAWILK